MILNIKDFNGRIIDEESLIVNNSKEVVNIQTFNGYYNKLISYCNIISKLLLLNKNEQNIFTYIVCNYSDSRYIKFDTKFFYNILSVHGIMKRNAKLAIDELIKKNILIMTTTTNTERIYLSETFVPDNVINNSVNTIIIRL